MSKRLDLSGQVFGRLTVLHGAGRCPSNRSVMWDCVCECGTLRVISSNSLRSGVSRSCGCYQKQQVSEAASKHGLCSHPLYQVYNGMKKRCYSPTHSHYYNYGGRGITVCDRWLSSFQNFYDDVHFEYRSGLQLDRIDNNCDYTPANVRWVTVQQNSFNKRGKSNTSSKYKGVCWDKSKNKWAANIQKDGKRFYLGRFSTELAAAGAYNIAAQELFGDYANLNNVET